MNIRNTKSRTSGTNTYKEHLLYNEKKWNVKKIDIVFDPRQLFDPCKDFMNSPHPRQNFVNPRHPRQNLTHTTHATHATQQTRYSLHMSYPI